MTSFFKRHDVARLLVWALAVIAFAKALSAFLDGYYIEPWLWMLYCVIGQGVLVLTIGSAVTITVASIIRRHFPLGHVAVGILSALLLVIPSEHFMTMGALLAVRNADPVQVRGDARILMDKYEPMTYFGMRERPPFDKPMPFDELPPSIRKAHVEAVLVLKDYTFMGKYGTNALLRGYIAFRDGSDPWQNGPPAILLSGCSYCWRFRIVDGLYWYHGVPRDEEIPTYASPLE